MRHKNFRLKSACLLGALLLLATLFLYSAVKLTPDNVNSAVVRIVVTGTGAGTEYMGTGFLISPKGYILTAAHLILSQSNKCPATFKSAADVQKLISCTDIDAQIKTAEQNASISVKFQFAISPNYKASIININPLYDLALIRITSSSPFPYLKIGKDSYVRVGEAVTVIGHPLGLSYTYSPNYVASKQITWFQLPLNQPISVPEYVYLLSYPEDQGSSGAPVLDSRNRVIGMVEQFRYLPHNVPIDLCTPVSTIRAYLNALGVTQ